MLKMAQQVAEHPLKKCYLCWKEYKDPQKLSCGHMFCCKCLHNVIVSLAQRSPNIEVRRVLECPICDLPADKRNDILEISSTTMKPLSMSAKRSEDAKEREENVIVSETEVENWFGSNADSHNAVKLPGINVEMCFRPSAKHEHLPIGWALSSREGNAIPVPRKLYKESSESFFSRQDIDVCDTPNRMEHAKDENNFREQQFLSSLELAEIQFLQPDSLRGESRPSQNCYEDEMKSTKICANEDDKRNGAFPLSSNDVKSVTSTIQSLSLNSDQENNKILRTSLENRLLPEITNTTSSQNLNGILRIQNFSYKGLNSISSIGKISRYSKGSFNPSSLKIFTSSRQQFTGKRQIISGCKYHSEQVASLYCTSCQLQMCNACFFDRHQHCTIQMSKEATCNLAQYLQEKLFQAKMLKAQLESWVSMFEGEITRVSRQADEIISYMTEMLQAKRTLIFEEIDNIRESSQVRKMQESYSECAELEDRLSVYLQELRWSSPDNCLVQPFLQSDVPSLHMPTSAELNAICLLRPVLQPNAFVVRTFLEMQNHTLGSVQLQCPVGSAGAEMKIAAGSHLAGQKLSHKMENILEKCLPSLPLKLCVFGTIKGDETAHHDAVDSIVLIPNKSAILSDPSNLKVKMVSFQGQRLGEISFESGPNGLCLWMPNVAAVTISLLKKIYFLNCENSLSVQSVVSTNKPYWGLAAGEIERTTCLLGAASHSSSVDILKYDPSLSTLVVLKTISPPKLEIWGVVCNICFTPKSSIVVADCFGSRVVCFNLEGKLLFDFPGHKDGLLKCPADATADEQYIYLSDIGNNRILRLSHDGVFNGVILTAQDGLLRPKAICIDEHGHLAISQFTEWPALLIFKTRL